MLASSFIMDLYGSISQMDRLPYYATSLENRKRDADFHPFSRSCFITSYFNIAGESGIDASCIIIIIIIIEREREGLDIDIGKETLAFERRRERREREREERKNKRAQKQRLGE